MKIILSLVVSLFLPMSAFAAMIHAGNNATALALGASDDFQSVCYIIGKSNGNYYYLGSGVAVGTNSIVTSAHGLLDDSIEFDSYLAGFGNDLFMDFGNAIEATVADFYPGYDGSIGSTSDLAMLGFVDPLPVPHASFYEGFLTQGDLLTTVGTGWTGSPGGTPTFDGKIRAFQQYVEAFGHPAGISEELVRTTFRSPGHPFWHANGGATTPGYSGGGNFILTPDGYQLASISELGFDIGGYNNSSMSLVINDERRAWAEERIAAHSPLAPVPEPATLAIFGMGIVGLVLNRHKARM